jgi:hypothetical protein
LLSKIPKINDDDSDCIIIEDDDIKIDWDSDIENIKKVFLHLEIR